MIEFKLFFALISYYFVMFVTPGPNNAMLTASGIKFGFKKTIPHLIGIPFGHVIQITLVCFGLGNLFQKYPLVQNYLKWLCFFYTRLKNPILQLVVCFRYKYFDYNNL